MLKIKSLLARILITFLYFLIPPSKQGKEKRNSAVFKKYSNKLTNYFK